MTQITQFPPRPVQISHFSLGHPRPNHDPVCYPDDPAFNLTLNAPFAEYADKLKTNFFSFHVDLFSLQHILLLTVYD
jgi:hypothetical protein